MTIATTGPDPRQVAEARYREIRSDLAVGVQGFTNAAAKFAAGLRARDWDYMDRDFTTWRDGLLTGVKLLPETRGDLALMLATEEAMAVRPIGELLGVSGEQAANDIKAAAARAGVNQLDTSNRRSEAARRREASRAAAKTNGDHPTPQDVFDELDRRYGPFDLDVCATAENTKVPVFISPEQDGLRQRWDGIVFCNPPYKGGQIGKWLAKAASEVAAGHAERVVCLVPANVTTQWWKTAEREASALFRWDGRITFGGYDDPAKFGSAVIVFGTLPDDEIVVPGPAGDADDTQDPYTYTATPGDGQDDAMDAEVLCHHGDPGEHGPGGYRLTLECGCAVRLYPEGDDGIDAAAAFSFLARDFATRFCDEEWEKLTAARASHP